MKIRLLCGETSAILIYSLLVFTHLIYIFIGNYVSFNFILIYYFFHKAFVKSTCLRLQKLKAVLGTLLSKRQLRL